MKSPPWKSYLLDLYSPDSPSSFPKIWRKEDNGGIISRRDIFLGFKKKMPIARILSLSDERLKKLIVKIPYDIDHPLNITITGRQGSGKSYLVGGVLFMDNLVRRMGVKGMMIDPSGEYCNLTQVTDDTDALRMWKRITGCDMKNIHSVMYSPRACYVEDIPEYTYMIQTDKISIMDLLKLMDITGSGTQEVSLRRRLLTGINKYYQEKEGKDDIRIPLSHAAPPYHELIDSVQKWVRHNSLLLDKLENLWREGVIGDVEPPEIIHYINDGTIPILKTSTDVYMRSRLASLIEIEIKKVIDARRKEYEGNGNENGLTSPVQICVDEWNIVVKKERFELWKNIYDQMRKVGIGIIGIAPSLMDLHKVVIRQSDYLICARVEKNSQEAKYISERLGDRVDIEEITDLEDLGKHIQPHEFALIDRNGELRRFYPPLSCSQHGRR